MVVVGGSLVGLELAEFLAERGRTVTLLEPGGQVGLPMAMPRRWTAVRRAGEHGVTILRHASLERITPTDVHYRTRDGERSVPADAVVVATDVRPQASLAEALRGRGVDVHVVGDAGEVGYIEGAVHSAWRTAATL